MTTMARILVVESDSALRAAIATALTAAGHEVETAAAAAAGLALARASTPDAIVFDLLADADGDDLCRSLRREPRRTAPILLVLTARADEDSRVAAFEAGVDDYLVKPHSMRELVLRLRVLLGRRAARRPAAEIVDLGALCIDRAARRVTVGGDPVLRLTHKEFDTLLYLADRRGTVQSREAIVEHVWGGTARSVRVVDTTLRRLRRKLGVARACLRTVRGVGYELRRAGA
jgi:two-component system phosphate regulon response regulator PhoB